MCSSSSSSSFSPTGSSRTDPKNEEPLLRAPSPSVSLAVRFLVTKPTDPLEATLWDFYIKHTASYWIPEHVEVTEKDLRDWERLEPAAKHLLKTILAFFAVADGIVIYNLDENLRRMVNLKPANMFYAIQQTMEDIHARTYTNLIHAFIKDDKERERLLTAVDNSESIVKKAQWALKYADKPTGKKDLGELLVAYAAVEGIFFMGAFAAIFYFRHKGLLSGGLMTSNEYIQRDESLHCDFGCFLYRHFWTNKLSRERIVSIITEAVETELEFWKDALRHPLPGLNFSLMERYIQYVADQVLIKLGEPPHYTASCPFDYMFSMSLPGKSNFFERRVTEYTVGGSTVDKNSNDHDHVDSLRLNHDF